jgi:hypothetical protein
MRMHGCKENLLLPPHKTVSKTQESLVIGEMDSLLEETAKSQIQPQGWPTAHTGYTQREQQRFCIYSRLALLPFPLPMPLHTSSAMRRGSIVFSSSSL